MGMFDYYEPRDTFFCPVCGAQQSEWQGKDGPRGLFVFREGAVGAVEQRVDEECRFSPEQMAAQRLPTEFFIYSCDCGCPYPTVLRGAASSNSWLSSELFTGSIADRVLRGPETREQWKARLRWLDSRAA